MSFRSGALLRPVAGRPGADLVNECPAGRLTL